MATTTATGTRTIARLWQDAVARDPAATAYLVEDARDRSSLTPEESLAVMRGLSEAYHGPWDDIREHLPDASTVNYTWFESHVLPAPWHRSHCA